MAMYCPECRAEYRPEIRTCAHCEVALVDHLPAEDAWSADDAGWRVVVAGDQESDLDAASTKLEFGGVPHMVVRRREDGTYLPPGASEAEVRPIRFEEWEEPWLLVVPRPRYSLASHLLRSVEEEAEREEMERQAEELEIQEETRERHGEQADPDYHLPWDGGPAPLSNMRKAFGVLLSGTVGLGTGLFLLKRYGLALLFLGIQLAWIFAAEIGLPAELRAPWIFLLVRVAEFVAAVLTAFKRPKPWDDLSRGQQPPH
jgi:hypothetical protein